MNTPTSALRPATSADVARLAGVSRATVSHVLNGQVERFPAETRQRVLDAAESLSYLPSPAGRSLASGRSDTIVVLLPNSTFSPILQNIVDKVTEGTFELGTNVVLQFIGDDLDKTVESLLRFRPIAVLDFSGLVGTEYHRRFDSMRTILVPRKTGETVNPEISGLVSQIAECQVDALISSSTRPMFFARLKDARSDVFGPIRADGVSLACRRRGIPDPGQLSVPLEIAGAIAALTPALDAGLPIAIACYNDDVALSLLAAARELGLSVPSDVSVVGVDNTRLGQLWQPRLTTVQVQMDLVVELAVHELKTALDSSTEPLVGELSQLVIPIPGATT